MRVYTLSQVYDTIAQLYMVLICCVVAFLIIKYFFFFLVAYIRSFQFDASMLA